MEAWKDICGLEGVYQVINLGRVKRLDGRSANGKRCREKILKQTISGNGYARVGLLKDGTQRILYVHRLVAEAFVPNDRSLPQVNHIDEDKLNNRAENLEWCSSRYNNNYGTRMYRAAQTICRNALDLIPTEDLIEELKRRGVL